MAAAALLCTADVMALPEPGTVGEVVLLEGMAELYSYVSGERFTIDEGTRIRMGHKIRTGENTLVSIVLNDGSRLSLHESTSCAFHYLREKKDAPPTKLVVEFGKVRMRQKKKFTNKTLELFTPTAEISVVTADFSAIIAETECLVLVHSGRVGLASVDHSVREAFVATEGEEVRVAAKRPPSPPVIVPKKGRETWLGTFLVVDRYRNITRRDRNREIIDWIIRGRDRDD